MSESHTQTPKWRRLPEERPLQIMRAAFEVFGEHGLTEARLEDIAKRAGVSKGTIYLYFPNKDALFKEMIRETMIRRLVEAESELGASAETAAEQLRRFLTAWWEFLRSETFQAIYRLVHSELQRFPDIAAFYGEEVVARNHALISGMLRRGVASGEFRELDPSVTARLIAASFISHSLWCAKQHLLPARLCTDESRALEHLLDYTFHAIRAASA